MHSVKSTLTAPFLCSKDRKLNESFSAGSPVIFRSALGLKLIFDSSSNLRGSLLLRVLRQKFVGRC